MNFHHDPLHHHGHRGGRGRRRGPGGGGPHFGGPRRGRARRGQVRMAALFLIAEEPRNGYQIIQELESRTDGRWKPSPGAVYPALAQLQDEGLIVHTDDQKVFEITDEGRTAVQEAGERRPWDDHGDEEPDATHDLRKAYQQLDTALGAVAESGNDEQTAKAAAIVEDARKSIYTLLAN